LSVALVAVFIWGTACTAYTQILPGDVAGYDNVRVYLTDGSEEELLDPTVTADTLRGYPTEGVGQVSIPLKQVKEIQTGKVDSDKITALVIITTLGVLTGVMILAWANSD
jgi:hypothetical protein